MTALLSRRRFVAITAFAGIGFAAAPLSAVTEIAKNNSFYHWRGFAMGANTSIKLYTKNDAAAERLTKLCLAEISRLEKIFSLHEPGSCIALLNRDGVLYNPPAEFVFLLRQARNYSAASEGAFDVTVQPLWQAYSTHAPQEKIRELLPLVDYKNIAIADDKISFLRAGMAITLNGIAQGYITDKVTDLLKKNGVSNVLVNMGEMRALGSHYDNSPWLVGIRNPDKENDVVATMELTDKAIATSGGYGMQFDEKHDHIFDPRTGDSPARYKSVSVIAPTATAADALSTALYVMQQKKAQKLISSLHGTRAILVSGNGKVSRLV